MKLSREKAKRNDVLDIQVMEKGDMENNKKQQLINKEINIKMNLVKKKKKRAVNYYLSEDLIKDIKLKAKEYNMKDSVFIEEILKEVFKSM